MASGSFGQLVAWVAIAIVIVVFIVAVIDESDDHKPKDMFGRKRQPNVDAVEKKESPKPTSIVASDDITRINATSNLNKPLIPPPGETRIEGVAPRTTSPKR
jgi:hypothetical protein